MNKIKVKSVKRTLRELTKQQKDNLPEDSQELINLRELTKQQKNNFDNLSNDGQKFNCSINNIDRYLALTETEYGEIDLTKFKLDNILQKLQKIIFEKIETIDIQALIADVQNLVGLYQHLQKLKNEVEKLELLILDDSQIPDFSTMKKDMKFSDELDELKPHLWKGTFKIIDKIISPSEHGAKSIMAMRIAKSNNLHDNISVKKMKTRRAAVKKPKLIGKQLVFENF